MRNVAEAKETMNSDTIKTGEPEDASLAKPDLTTDAEADAADGDALPVAPAIPAKRPLGTKEVVPFAWKVIGTSGDTVLTLFKSIEPADSEAQLARLRKDGYYSNLRVVEADFKVVQPKPAKKRKLAAPKLKTSETATAKPKQTAEDNTKTAKTTSKTTAKKTKATPAEATKKGTAAKQAEAPKKKAAAKSTEAAENKTAKKKTAKKKTAKKKTVKKKAAKKTGKKK